MWFPLAKAREEVHHGERQRIVYGPISAEVPDGVQDVVVQDGMDCEPLVREGYVNWDHLDGPQHLIGEPLSTRPCKLNDRGEIDDRHGTIPATEGRVLLYQGHPPSDAVWSLIQAQERTPHAKRRVGFSVQGEILEKQGHYITKSRIRHLAMSHQPLMPLSFAAIAKSLRKTQGAVPALQTLNLDAGDGWVWGRCPRGRRPCYDPHTYRFHDGIRGMLGHFVRCQGWSLPFAKAVVRGLARSLTGGA
ncbi:MAG: hypothetical protein K6V97_03910 [Actinomycetia bacterium]|nr:hypothetical protein [Actinomycetes bacterium]